MPMSNVNTANQDKAEKNWANQWWTDEDKTMNSEHKHIAHTHTWLYNTRPVYEELHAIRTGSSEIQQGIASWNPLSMTSMCTHRSLDHTKIVSKQRKISVEIM